MGPNPGFLSGSALMVTGLVWGPPGPRAWVFRSRQDVRGWWFQFPGKADGACWGGMRKGEQRLVCEETTVREREQDPLAGRLGTEWIARLEGREPGGHVRPSWGLGQATSGFPSGPLPAGTNCRECQRPVGSLACLKLAQLRTCCFLSVLIAPSL